jgi:hypothetical protein
MQKSDLQSILSLFSNNFSSPSFKLFSSFVTGFIRLGKEAHTKNLARVFGHQWVISALFYRDFLLPLRAKLYHPKGARGCGPFHTKITLAKKIIQNLNLPIPCKLYVLVDSWY